MTIAQISARNSPIAALKNSTDWSPSPRIYSDVFQISSRPGTPSQKKAKHVSGLVFVIRQDFISPLETNIKCEIV